MITRYGPHVYVRRNAIRRIGIFRSNRPKVNARMFRAFCVLVLISSCKLGAQRQGPVASPEPTHNACGSLYGARQNPPKFVAEISNQPISRGVLDAVVAVSLDNATSTVYAVTIDGYLRKYRLPNLEVVSAVYLGQVSLAATVISLNAGVVGSAGGETAGIKANYPGIIGIYDSANASRGVSRWELASGKALKTLDTSQVQKFAVAPAQDEVADVGGAGVTIYNPAFSLSMHGFGYTNVRGKETIEALAYNSAGDWMVFASTNGAVWLQKVDRTRPPDLAFTADLVLESPYASTVDWPDSPTRPLAVAIDPHNKYVALERADRLWLYSLSETARLSLGPGSSGPHADIRFNPDGTQLAVASIAGLEIYDMNSRTSLETFSDASFALDYSADGQWLVTGTADGRVRLYKVCS